jgi:hypothetical protein
MCRFGADGTVMRRLLVPLLIGVIAALGFAVAGQGQALGLTCPATDLPSIGAAKVITQGKFTTVMCGYTDGFHGYELSLNYYPPDTPADHIASMRKLDPNYCTSFRNGYKVYTPGVVAFAQVGGNPKSWADALGYATAFLAQANGVAYSCSTPAPAGDTSGTSRGGCPGTKPVTKTSDRVGYAWRFSFSGVPVNATLARDSTSSGSGSGRATTFHCFYADGTVDEPRTGSGGGSVKFFPRKPPSTATFSFAITGSPREYVKGRTVTLTLQGAFTKIKGSSCKTGPTTVALVNGSQDSVSVSLCGATLKYVNGRGARVSVSIG